RGRATILDIAREAGVSPATVSNALNDRRYVEAETKERVKAVAARLGYAPNLRAQRLRTGRADTIALVSSMPFAVAAGPSRLGFLMEIAAVAASAALESGMALVLVPPSERTGPAIETLAIDGAIVVEPTADDSTVARLRAAGHAVVSIGRQPGDKPVPYVDLRSGPSTGILLDHLWDRSSRRIALVVGAQRRNSYVEAEEEFQRFAARKEMPPLILRVDETSGEDGACAAVEGLLSTHPEVDALCVPVDAFAVGANRAALRCGRHVPADLRLVTRYDGLRARQCQPNLTALDLKLDEVAARAVELLMEWIRTGQGRAFAEGPEPTLILRGSSVGE
ncbi:MAG: LacI family DNA-binding transcriptional regulator, partial [Pararhizobium sp.]